tara:strand:- start:409 stop:1182 length:774 start_codon:yes stop_codon:yes gene_type:complete
MPLSQIQFGTAKTDGTLHVHTASAGTVAASTQADDLVVENNAEGGMTIITPDNESARIRFTSPSTNNDIGGATIFYRQNINKMNVGTGVAGGKLDLLSGAGASAILADGDGNVTMAKQPSFYADKTDSQQSVGVNTDTTIIYNTERYDVGGNFASNTFTAPVTGKYYLNAGILIGNAPTDANYLECAIVTSNRRIGHLTDYDGLDHEPVYWGVNMSCIVDMDANDTAAVRVYQAGGVDNTFVFHNSASSYFCGMLIG